jgi:hypothetical protein
MDGHKPDQDTSFSGVLKRVISPISDAKQTKIMQLSHKLKSIVQGI